MNPKIIIRLFLNNYSEALSLEIIETIKNKISSKFIGVDVKLNSSEQYWKFPELTECCFSVLSNEDVSVKEILDKLTSVDYMYKKVELPNGQMEEEAIWNIHTHGGEFIHKNVEWAHIYTWKP